MDSPVWFITGASSGLGESIALEALSRGHKVIGTARNSSKLTKIAEAGATVLSLDVTADQKTVTDVVDKAFAIHGKLTHIINAAGYTLEGALEETSSEEAFAQFNTNVLGTITVSRTVIPHLRAQGYGSITNFGSLGSWSSTPAVTLYCATKAAVSVLTEGLYEELRPFGIDVCILEPGYFRTGFLNPGHRVSTEKTIKEYQGTTVGDWKAKLDSADNNQLGDPVKGGKVVVDVLTKTGVAKGREVPMRLVIGSDCVAAIRQKCKDTLEGLDEWEKISASTDF